MPGYLEAQNNNEMVKTMMLNQSCDHVSGDDTNQNGYRLMVPEDDECGCHVVRSLRSDLGVGIHVDNNSLILYNTKEYARSVISGGDIVSITTRVNILSCWFRFSGTIRFRPLGVSEAINVTMPPGSQRRVRIFGLPQRSIGTIPTPDGVQLDPDNAVYLTADPSLIDGWDQPDMVLATNRNIDVLNRSEPHTCYATAMIAILIIDSCSGFQQEQGYL